MQFPSMFDYTFHSLVIPNMTDHQVYLGKPFKNRTSWVLTLDFPI